METLYTHLELEERCRLRGLMEMVPGTGEIARRLRRHRATIYREVGRNRCVNGAASWLQDGQRRTWARKTRMAELLVKEPRD